MAVYKLLICPVCKYQQTAQRVARSGTWCAHCKAYHPQNVKRCPTCGKQALEAGAECPRHPGQHRYYTAKWYVRAAGQSPRAVSEKYNDAVGEEATLTKNRIEGRGHLNRIRKTPWKDCREAFIKWAENNVRPGTLNRMFIPSLDRLETRLGHLTLDRITPEMIEEHKKHYLAIGNAASTINHDITTIKRMLVKAVSWGMVEQNNLTSVERLTEADPRERYLSDDEISKLLERCRRKAGCKCPSIDKCKCKKRPRRYAYIFTLVAIHTGLRKGDIRTLKRSDIDMQAGVIRKELQKKTTKRKISIPMTKTLQAELKTYMATSPPSIAGWLFPSPTDKTKPMHQHANIGFNAAAKEAGINDLHFHDLRHTFATKFLRVIGIERGKDASLMILKELLGHTDIKTTQRYAHVLDEYLHDAMRDFGENF